MSKLPLYSSLKIMKKVWNFIKRKKWWFVLGVAVVIVILLVGGKKPADYVFDTVSVSDVSETILATGQVISDTDLQLSFAKSGIVDRINVSVGDRISRGQIIATLKNQSAAAILTQAQAALDRAEAAYQQLLDGATSEEVEVARVALESAEIDYSQSEIQQNRLVSNSLRTLLSSGLEAVPALSTSETAPTITGTYNSTEEGTYVVRLYSAGGGQRFSVNGLETSDGDVDSSRPAALGTRGLFIQFDEDTSVNAKWNIEIPNTRGSSYVSNLNAYEAAQETRDITLATKQNAIDSAEANLNNLLANATGPELALAESDVLSAQGQVNAALAALEDTRIRAPESGTVTRIDAHLGELIQAYESAVVLQDTEELLLEANINEANITKVSTGMPIEVTFDAFSFDETFMAEVVSIDIASTLVSGVVNYRIKARLTEELPELRPGMTANMTLIVEEKESVLAISGRAVIEKGDETFVLVKDGDDIKEVSVEIGFEGDGTIVEVSSGLSEGDEVVVNP
jgi:RND family efflux transporter MFP subunit